MTITIDGTNVVFSWDTPSDNFEPLLEYEVVIEDSQGAYVIDTDHCDVTAALSLASPECTIPMDGLITLTGLV